MSEQGVSRGREPGRPSRGRARAWMSRAERGLAVAAPRPDHGFVSRLVEVGGVRLHVREHAGSGGPAWVLLHGLAVSHRSLMPTAAALRPAPVYVPDLPGFGRSGKPRTVLGPRRHAETVAAWMDGAGLRGAAVLGHSFGAQVAVELAVRRPELVAALVLVGPTVDPAAPTAAGQFRRWLRDLVHEDPRELPLLARDGRDAGPRRILGTLRRSTAHRIERRLPLLAAPALFLRGEYDPIAPRDWLARAAAVAPRARVGEVAGAGHNAVTTAGPAVAALASAFVAPGPAPAAAQTSGTSCSAASSALAPPPAGPAS